jgi:hypothetical protein
VQLERKQELRKKEVKAKPLIRTLPGENGMTITIIQNDSQIEITVKDN